MPSDDPIPSSSSRLRVTLAWILVILLTAWVLEGVFFKKPINSPGGNAGARSFRTTAPVAGSSGRLETEGNPLEKISDMDWTLRSITLDGAPVEHQEQTYLSGLGRIDRMAIAGHTLSLTDSLKTVTLTFGLEIPEGIEIGHSASSTGKAAMARLIYRGRVASKGDAFVFSPCGSDAQVELRDHASSLRPLFDEPGTGAKSSLYVEFHGVVVEEEVADEFPEVPPQEPESSRTASSSRRTAVLHLNDLLFLAGEGGSCEHPLPRCTLLAYGNEPFWRVRVEEDRSILSFPGSERVLTGGMTPDDAFFSARSGKTVLTLSDPRGGGAVSLQLERQPCRDSMSGAWSSVTALLRHEGRHDSGCARPGRYVPPAAGSYRAEIAKANPAIGWIELRLDDSGAAYLRYEWKKDGHPSTLQEGIWQPSGPSRAEVFLLLQESRRIYERLLLQREGNDLRVIRSDPERWKGEGLRLRRVAAGAAPSG